MIPSSKSGKHPISWHRLLIAPILLCVALTFSAANETQATAERQATEAQFVQLTDPVINPNQSGVLFFPETGHSLRGSFRTFWEENGGLAQFGYPITEEFFEPADNDNRPLQVQYFERNRFELHPENAGSRYEVLLGSLGREFHTQDLPAAQQPTPTIYFPETGHNLQGKFREYWEAHGGLGIYGYPISEQTMEQSTKGQAYLVQWFERARLELHPENAGSNYEILVGLLGRQLTEKKGYPFGWYPTFGRAVDWSWISGIFFPDPRLCPDCGCDTIRYVFGATRATDPTTSFEPIGQPWLDVKANSGFSMLLTGYPVVVTGHLPKAGEPVGRCAAPGYIVERGSQNPTR